jgi:uncharacterized protein (DUF1778 family)
MATSRLDMRIDESVKADAEKAAALLGKKNLSEYITQLIRENSEAVIREYGTITVQDNVFERFTAACDAAEEPNSKLRAAAARTQKKGFK